MIVLGMLLDLFEMSPQRIFRHFLEIDVYRCANTKTFVFRAVPSNCSDYLLTDVIDRIALPLCVLPAPGDDLFRSRTSAALTADKSKIAHPIKCEVAHLARIVAVRPWR